MPIDDRVLIDYRTADDAGVYRLDDERALVQTVDFFTPIVDDPFIYGRIAAANALSDVYAMGGRPLTALAVAGFPKDLDVGSSRSIFAGGLDTLHERRRQPARRPYRPGPGNQVRLCRDRRGAPGPDLANAGAQPGDVLFLTKPLGTGIIATALKSGRAPDVAGRRRRWQSMLTLNRAASEALQHAAGRSRARLHRRHRLRPDRPRVRDGRRQPGARSRSTRRRSR